MICELPIIECDVLGRPCYFKQRRRASRQSDLESDSDSDSDCDSDSDSYLILSANIEIRTMAETAGLVIGGISLASLFNSCVDSFRLVQIAKDAGIDFETCTIQLDLLQLRLTRWGSDVHIEEQEPAMGSDDWAKVKAALQNLANLFQRASENSFEIPDSNKLQTSTGRTSQKIRDLAARYQKAKGKAEGGRGKLTTMQKCKWAVHTAEDMQKLLNDIVLILDSLERIIPCSKAIENLLPIELDELSKFNSQSLEIVNRVTAKRSIDPLLEQQLKNLNPRRYAARALVADNRLGAFARFVVGDTGKIDRGEKAPRPNPNGSDVIGNTVAGEGRMQVGDDYTGRSFWD
ncbi:hypothetical protein BTUL_0070g00460 [Botrytis tulipae]|uniref:Prion-inhibition and propagation HeLo domain-containing protein n=1 Tax=Botrytis tulipae TaxID=87230 RepID=A0A4Z1ELU8_9HELO|nr:hypothetical protein BTUL_0070g00460 [Botrytis tulipae]